MPKQLSADGMNERRDAAKEWINSKALKEAFKTKVTAQINEHNHWDDQVSSNTICRKLRKPVCEGDPLHSDPTSENDPRVTRQLADLFTIVAMNASNKIPHTFRVWVGAPTYWDEIMNDVDRFLEKQVLHTDWLDPIILASAKVVPGGVNKRELEANARKNADKTVAKIKDETGAVIKKLESEKVERNNMIIGLHNRITYLDRVANDGNTRITHLEGEVKALEEDRDKWKDTAEEHEFMIANLHGAVADLRKDLA